MDGLMRKCFKVDLRKYYTCFPVALYVKTRWSWRELEYFETVEAARARYEQIKDLPEYLD